MWVVTILSCLVSTSALDLLDCSSETGQNVTLTFYFSEDISKDHEINGVSVLRYHHQALDDLEPVVECIWFPPRNLRCLETPGYELIKPITDTVRIVIKNYSDERHGGFYSCQASPGQQFISKKCKLPLHLKDKQTEISTQTPDIHETTGYRENEQHERCNDRGTDFRNFAILSSINSLTLVLLLSAVFCFIMRRQKAPMCLGYLCGTFQHFRSSSPLDYLSQHEALNTSCHQSPKETEADLQQLFSLIRLWEQNNRNKGRQRVGETSFKISVQAANEKVQEMTRSSAHAAFSSNKEDDAEEAGGLPLLAEKANVHSKGHRADDLSSEHSV